MLVVGKYVESGRYQIESFVRVLAVDGFGVAYLYRKVA